MRKQGRTPAATPKPLADALFPDVRQDLFAATFMHPERWWYLSDLARHLGRTPSSLQRELGSLLRSGILRHRLEANRVYYQPDPRCPIYPELLSLTLKTVGLADGLRDALEPLHDQIQWAFVFGSIARGDPRSLSDVDLMVIGSVSLRSVAGRLRGVHQRLQREINPIVFPLEEFRDRHRKDDPFLKTVTSGPRISLIGDLDELQRALESR